MDSRDGVNPPKRAKMEERSAPIRPIVFYGSVTACVKEDDGSTLRLTVTWIRLSSFPILPFRFSSRTTGERCYFLLTRSSTIVHPQDRVSILVLTPDSDPATVVVSSSTNNYLILSPDHLLTATNLAVSFTCLRRAVLSSFTTCYQDNRHSIFGRLRHDLIEV